MNTTTKLVAAGLTGALAAGLIAGGIAWASAARVAEAPSRPVETPVAPVPSPRLEPELATTHRASTEAAPAPREATPAPRHAAPRDDYEPELEASGGIRVRRLVLATGVERHEPTGASNVFRLRGQERIYAFVDAVNETGESVELNVTFEPPQGESTGHVALRVPARVARYRTWAWTRHVYETGRWEAVVRAPDGRVIARRAFDVE